MHGLYDKVEEAVAFIRQRWQGRPHAGVILGTGLGSFVQHIQEEASYEYEDIPHFPRSTATSHRGRLVCGTLAGLPVVAMEGRFQDRKSTRLNSSHSQISYAVFCLKKKKKQ